MVGVEQPFDFLIFQNRQTMQSMGRSIDWTLEDNMVDGLFICATLTGRRGDIPHLYKQERKRPTPVQRRLSRTQAVLGRVITRGWVPVSEIKVWGLAGIVRPLHIPLVIRPMRCTCCCCQISWWDVLRRVQTGVSIWDAMHSHSVDGWALIGAGVQAPWHSVLWIVWLLCDKAQKVGCLPQHRRRTRQISGGAKDFCPNLPKLCGQLFVRVSHHF